MLLAYMLLLEKIQKVIKNNAERKNIFFLSGIQFSNTVAKERNIKI